MRWLIGCLKLYAPALVCFVLAGEIEVWGTDSDLAFALRLVALGASIVVMMREQLRRRKDRDGGS